MSSIRKDFIDYMKNVVERYAESDLGEDTNWDSSDGITIGNADEGTDETSYNWVFDLRDVTGALALTFYSSFMPRVGLGSSNSKTIWLNSEALENKELVKNVFAKAESAIEQCEGDRE